MIVTSIINFFLFIVYPEPITFTGTAIKKNIIVNYAAYDIHCRWLDGFMMEMWMDMNGGSPVAKETQCHSMVRGGVPTTRLPMSVDQLDIAKRATLKHPPLPRLNLHNQRSQM